MSTRWPLPLVPCALLAASAPVTAPAATAIQLRTTGELPFTPEELESLVQYLNASHYRIGLPRAK